MYSESVLLESRSLRSGMTHQVDVLDKVKALALAPDGVHATTQDVADYFEVADKVVYNLLSRHRQELQSNGLRILRGAELQEFKTFNVKVSSEAAQSYPQARNGLAVYTRRTVLNVAMLLRDSPVARRVRRHLLDAEAELRSASPAPARSGPERPVSAAAHAALVTRVSRVESAVAEIGSLLQELGPVIQRMSVRVQRIDRRLAEVDRRSAGTERVVCALSRRMADMGEDMRVMRADLDHVVREVVTLRSECRPHG